MPNHEEFRKPNAEYSSDWDVLTRFTNLPAPVRRHVRQVYTHLARLAGVATATCYVGNQTNLLSFLQNPFILFIAMAFCTMQIVGTDPTPLARTRRRNYSYAYAALMGVGVQPVVDLAVAINPNIVLSSMLTTALVFGSFSFTAMRTESRSLLYLGGVLTSLLSYLIIGSLANTFFFHSASFMFAEMYVGIMIFCGFIMYSTQLMIRDAEDGNMDVIGHSVNLFSDMINLFVRIAVLLIDRERSSRERRKKR